MTRLALSGHAPIQALPKPKSVDRPMLIATLLMPRPNLAFMWFRSEQQCWAYFDRSNGSLESPVQREAFDSLRHAHGSPTKSMPRRAGGDQCRGACFLEENEARQ
jgi:hypothetical protein